MNGTGGISFSGLYIRAWCAHWALLWVWFHRAPRSFAIFVSWYVAVSSRG